MQCRSLSSAFSTGDRAVRQSCRAILTTREVAGVRDVVVGRRTTLHALRHSGCPSMSTRKRRACDAHSPATINGWPTPVRYGLNTSKRGLGSVRPAGATRSKFRLSRSDYSRTSQILPRPATSHRIAQAASGICDSSLIHRRTCRLPPFSLKPTRSATARPVSPVRSMTSRISTSVGCCQPCTHGSRHSGRTRVWKSLFIFPFALSVFLKATVADARLPLSSAPC